MRRTLQTVPLKVLRRRFCRDERMVVIRSSPFVIVSVDDLFNTSPLVVRERVVIVLRGVHGQRRADEPALDERQDRRDGGSSESDVVENRLHDPADSASGPRIRQSNTGGCPVPRHSTPIRVGFGGRRRGYKAVAPPERDGDHGAGGVHGFRMV